MTFTCVTIAVRSSSWPWLLPPRSSSLDFQLDNMQLVTLANLPEGLSDVINSLQVVESRVEGRVRAPLLLKDIPNLEKLGT